MDTTIVAKACTFCKKIKPLSDFYKHRRNGYQSHCKTCQLANVKAYRRTERGRSVDNAASARYQQTARGQVINLAYRQSTHGKAIRAKATQRFRIAHPDRIQASVAVKDAVRRGILMPPTSFQCKMCDNTAEHYHHHKGYEEEHKLDVVPLCHVCHVSIHHPTPSSSVGL